MAHPVVVTERGPRQMGRAWAVAGESYFLEAIASESYEMGEW